mmetsp:Transcript_15729/g.27668  ORF Transcript_15729/g.27668 Transcript_15729/m.27668 type:complete len:258 (-) Transcript_15729:388-1161(-)
MQTNAVLDGQRTHLANRVDGAVGVAGRRGVHHDGVGANGGLQGVQVNLEGVSVEVHFDQLDAHHITSLVHGSVGRVAHNHLRGGDVVVVAVVVTVALDRHDDALGTSRRRAAADTLVTAVHQVGGHGDHLTVELHHTGPDVRVQGVGNGVHGEGLVEQVDVLVLAVVNCTGDVTGLPLHVLLMGCIAHEGQYLLSSETLLGQSVVDVSEGTTAHLEVLIEILLELVLFFLEDGLHKRHTTHLVEAPSEKVLLSKDKV